MLLSTHLRYISLSRRQLVLIGAVVPLGVFMAARSAVSWRPQLVARQNHVDPGPFLGSHFLHLSPDEKWLATEDDYQKTTTLWKLSNTRQKRTLTGTQAVFSNDSRLIATGGFESEKLYLNDSSRLLWSRKLPQWDYDTPVSFTPNNTAIQYHDDGPYIEGSTVTVSIKDGKLLSKKIIESSPWETESIMSKSEDIPEKTKVSFYSKNSEQPTYSFETSNGDDRWEVAPDKKHLWVSLTKRHLVDVRDTQTGRVLWSYQAEEGGINADGTPSELSCYPSWESGGKSLATIENDILTVRDAQTGKIVLQHKNNLPSPLKSWAFTHDGNTVYLMDQTGKIFRQRVR